MSCSTISGKTPNLPCVFPFEFEGTTYHSCSWEDGTRWCSTKVDENGQHLKGNWGNCESNCPMGCHVLEQRTGKFKPCVFPFARSETGLSNIFRSCADVDPKNPDGRLMCPTKTDNATNLHINGQGFWGFCDEKYCPKTEGMINFYPYKYYLQYLHELP